MATVQREAPPSMTTREFDALHTRLRESVEFGPDDRRGALNYITPARVRAAIGEVRSGTTVSLASAIATNAQPDNPRPARHAMTAPIHAGGAAERLEFAMDQFAMNVHGDADSHIDALCHVVYDQTLYNGVSGACVTGDGALDLSIDTARNGIVGRGVLLDIPGSRGVPWLDVGDHVTAEDLLAAEKAQGVEVGEGDIALVRVGHHARRRELGPWNVAEHRAGLHPNAVELLAQRRIAVLGGDGNNDTAPSAVDGVAFPVHVLAINALGIHLMDYLHLEPLRELCAASGQWSFLCTIAPLRLTAGTGSPVNPIAVL